MVSSLDEQLKMSALKGLGTLEPLPLAADEAIHLCPQQVILALDTENGQGCHCDLFLFQIESPSKLGQ